MVSKPCLPATHRRQRPRLSTSVESSSQNPSRGRRVSVRMTTSGVSRDCRRALQHVLVPRELGNRQRMTRLRHSRAIHGFFTLWWPRAGIRAVVMPCRAPCATREGTGVGLVQTSVNIIISPDLTLSLSASAEVWMAAMCQVDGLWGLDPNIASVAGRIGDFSLEIRCSDHMGAFLI